MSILTTVSGDKIFFFQAEDGIRDIGVTGVQTCALPISLGYKAREFLPRWWASPQVLSNWRPRFSSAESRRSRADSGWFWRQSLPFPKLVYRNPVPHHPPGPQSEPCPAPVPGTGSGPACIERPSLVP